MTDRHDAQNGNAMPEVTFSTFILSLASSVLLHLGEVPDPETGETRLSLPLAKHTIDVLEMLRVKTEKGLEAQERAMLESILYELRMKFVMHCGPDCAAAANAQKTKSGQS